MFFFQIKGLLKDDSPLLGTWSMKKIESRQWRVSKMAPLAGNIAFAQYKCPHLNTNKTFIELIHNEKVTPVPGCNSERLCSFDSFKGLIEPYLTLSFDNVCENN